MFRKILESDYFSELSLCTTGADCLELLNDSPFSPSIFHTGDLKQCRSETAPTLPPHKVSDLMKRGMQFDLLDMFKALVFIELTRLMTSVNSVTATSAFKHTWITQPPPDAA